MNFSRNKKTATITLVLALTITATLVALPTVTAHDPPWEVPTWCYISLSNYVIGQGQEVLVVMWSHVEPPTGLGRYGDRWTFTVEVTKPDNTIETLGPLTSGPVGAAYTLYTPDQVGTYTFVATWLEHTITGEPAPPAGTDPRAPETVGDVFLESTSDPVTLTVQQDPIEGWVEPPVTEDYWERPLSDINRFWHVLTGNWMKGAAQVNGPTNNFAYGRAPESGHILWTTPYWSGGLMDERFGPGQGFYTGESYEGFGNSPVILDGRIYYNVETPPRYGVRVLDLYNGEQIQFHNTTGSISGVNPPYGFDFSGDIDDGQIAFGQIYNYQSPNQHGGFPYLWSTNAPTPNTWKMYDGFTGNWICDIANVSSAGTAVYGKDGSILRYRISGEDGAKRLTVWNTSRAIWYEDVFLSNEFWMWRPVLGETFDGNNGFSLDVSIPDVSSSIRAVREDEFVISGTLGTNDPDGVVMGKLSALSLEKGNEGTLLWETEFTPPYVEATYDELMISGSLSYHGPEFAEVVPEYDCFLIRMEMTGEYWCYSLSTGDLLWGPVNLESPYTVYGLDEYIYMDQIIVMDRYGGKMQAYDIETGDFNWEYILEQEGFESPYGRYTIYEITIADGKIYTGSNEHSPTMPLWRGSRLRCIDASNGEELFTISHWWTDDIAIADGYIVGNSAYDNRIYCYGKGPSKTTVTAAPKTIALGSSVIIEGTVTDQSPGAKTTAVMAKSSNAEGIPCIADEDMSEWMEYLYMQQAIPADATGVPVILDAISPDGSYINIGTVTSDMSGFFSYMWEPEMEGKYTIIATFEGEKSYSSSYAETAIGVGPAPSPGVEPTTEPPTTAPPTTPPPTGEAPLITTEVAIIAAVAVVAVIAIAAYWAFRRRK